jgi:sugar phosphate isomerase/epimerase
MKCLTFFFIVSYSCFSLTLRAQQTPIPFFVFNNGVKDSQYNTLEKQAQLLKTMGFDGMEMKGVDSLAETLVALDKYGLKVFTMYLNIDLDNERQPYDKELKDVFSQLKGRGTMPWFYITSKKYKPSSEENDSIAVRILREIADMANDYGIKVMIYPHINLWVNNVEDAVRVAEKVNRRNVGLTFNLCHFLADEGTNANTAFLPLVKRAIPYVFAITLNGADNPTEEIMKSGNLWQYFIQPLGEGNYNTSQYLNAFVERGFRGPVGLQCYNLKTEKSVYLKNSMSAWKNLQGKLAARQ